MLSRPRVPILVTRTSTEDTFTLTLMAGRAGMRAVILPQVMAAAPLPWLPAPPWVPAASPSIHMLTARGYLLRQWEQWQEGDSLAISTGTGPSGSAVAYTTSNWGNGYFVTGHASAPIANGTSLAVAGTNVEQPITNLAEAQGKQAATFGTALPNKSSINPLLAQNPKVLASFTSNSTVLGYGVLGGTASSSDPMTFTASLASNLNTQNIINPQHLLVGLLDSSFSGPDFASLEFSIVGQGNQLFDRTFTSGAQALAFFDDTILDLGLLTSIVGSGSGLNLTFNYSLVGSNNSGFAFNFVYGNGNSTSPVPIPGTVGFSAPGWLG